MTLYQPIPFSPTLFLASLALVAGPASEVVCGEPPVLASWGAHGSGPGEFISPQGLAVGASGTVYVTDALNHRIQLFSSAGDHLGTWGRYGAGPAEFCVPQRIAVDAAENVYVTDSGNFRVQKLTKEGEFVLDWSTRGDEQSELSYGITVSPTDEVFVASAATHEIWVFEPGGVRIRKWGGFGTDPGKLRIPRGIAWATGLYVTDSLDRVQKFGAGGALEAAWGSSGGAPGELRSPRDVSVGPRGNVYVVDAGNYRIQVFTPEGTFLTAWGSYGMNEGQFIRPTAIAVDRDGNVFVAETRVHRIQKFAPIDLKREGR